MGNIQKRSELEVKLRRHRSDIIMQEVFEKQKVQNKTPDTENRKKVKSIMLKLVMQGKSKEEAVDFIMKNKIVEKFNYLSKNGLDIRTCLMNWLEAEMRVNNIEEEDYER